MSIEHTLAERGNRYGDFADHAVVAQELQDVMRRHGTDGAAYWEKLTFVQRQALTVIADKIARILSGDPNYADNWHDIQGYAKLVEDRLPRQVEAVKPVYDPAEHLQDVQDMAITFGERVAIMHAYIQAGDTGETYTEYETRMLGKAQALINPADVDTSDAVTHTELSPELWEIGDFIVAVRTSKGAFTKGATYEVASKPGTHDVMVMRDDKGVYNGWGHDKFRFHSRPTK